MVKLWQGESAAWRVELELDGPGGALALRTGAQGRVLIVGLGKDPGLETLRRAAAKAVKALRELGADSAVLDAYQQQLAQVQRQETPEQRGPTMTM